MSLLGSAYPMSGETLRGRGGSSAESRGREPPTAPPEKALEPFPQGSTQKPQGESGVWKVGCLQNLPSPVSKPDAQRTLKADLSAFWRNALGAVVGKIYDLLYIVIRS